MDPISMSYSNSNGLVGRLSNFRVSIMPLEKDSIRLVKCLAVEISDIWVGVSFILLLVFVNVMSMCSSMGVTFCSESIVCVLFDEFRLFSVGVVDKASVFLAKISRSEHFLMMSLKI